MKKQVLVSADRGETRVCAARTLAHTPKRRRKTDPAEGYQVAELYFERRGARSIVGNVYKGKVDNVLPRLEAAFVDIGLEKNGFPARRTRSCSPASRRPKRGRGTGGGPKITDLLKPGQEIVVQSSRIRSRARVPVSRWSSPSPAATSCRAPPVRAPA